MAKTLTLAIVLTLTLLAALQQTTVAQKLHVVGDGLGWIVPPGGPIAYITWADMQTFTAGDILMFNFTTGDQDVARVTKEAFDNCNSTNPIWLATNGPVNYTLSSGGDYYFIGTMERHCFFGQKLAVKDVKGAPTPMAPPPPPSPPVPTPPRAAKTYVVGDDLGWLVPPGGAIAYSTWAYNKTFFIGDTLVFNFVKGVQDVAEVSKAAYESCDTTTPITVLTTSPAKITLTTAGDHFFTSTYPRHCGLGQKLAISVMGTTASPTPPPPPPTPAVPAPPVPPMTYVVGDDLGWLVPPGGEVAYSTWAYNKTFIVGDTLVFNFKNGTQDVAVVTKAAYESCDTAAATTVLTTSPAKINLTSPGEHFFTSTYPDHCRLGQKLAINVTGTAMSPPSTTTGSPAYAPGPGGPAPPPTSSAPWKAITCLFSVTYLSIAIAFLL
ncbi:early nodulin-like protein 2 [Actinidia eriantha]|uniref:early nodulin-like protein 2 n=1 Tax=Actinidia eriantha TaxID=165200 RepID=UPI002588FC1B|nr:early nodulin-like protein 2 [Actinidia eriantha]